MKNKEIAGLSEEMFGFTPKIEDDKILYFEDAAAEYEALYTGVGVRFPVNTFVLKLTGKDVLDFLHRITTNALNDLKEGESRKTIFTNEKGRILDSVLVIRKMDFVLLIGNLPKKETITAWINKYVIMDDVHIEDHTENYTVLELSGGQMPVFTTLLLGNKYESQKENFAQSYDELVPGLEVIIRRGLHNRLNVLLCFDHALLPDVLNLFLAIKNIFEYRFIGSIASDRFRIDQGIPDIYELSDDFNPYEANIIHEVNFKKGCYIGQEVIARLDTYDKVQRVLTAVELHPEEAYTVPLPVFNSEDKEIGRVTTVQKFEDGKVRGLAIIRKNFLNNGHELYVAAKDTKLPISHSDLPLRKIVL